MGFLLRVEASYDDGEGEDKSAEQASAHPVRAAPATNVPPVFPDTDADTTGVQQAREVAENTPAGEDIGDAVVATDPGDVLDLLDWAALMMHKFSLDRATGQLRTKGALDFDTATGGSCHTHRDRHGHGPVRGYRRGHGDRYGNECERGAADRQRPRPRRTISQRTTAATLTLTVGAAYTAADPEGLTVSWSVSGPDSGKFTIPAGS